jgi:peptide chain release factor 3
VKHLLQEGALQSFRFSDPAQNVPLLGAVGVLQFEVFKYRLEHEYGAVARLEPAPYKFFRWVDESAGAASVVTESMLPPSCKLAFDSFNRKVVLFDSEWILKFFCERNPEVRLLSLPVSLNVPR